MKTMNAANKTSSSEKKISSIFIMIISVMLIVSVIGLYEVVEASLRGVIDFTNLILSLSAIGISSYMLLQLKPKTLKLGFEPQKVLTTVECHKCGYTDVRDFQQGDFILKWVGPCPKCSEEQMMISSIYRKQEEKK